VGGPLTDAGHKVEGFFYNPNIHPLIEFRRRLKSVRVLQEQLKFPLRAVEEYGLRRFLRLVAFREDQSERCPLCYRQRLYRTAQYAAENGYDAFTTTLLWPGSKAAHEEAKRRQLYLQNYCGCIYSEYERYRDTTKELYKGKG
jgi:predicted adenine nucleotide alpha hydrolase (AANH) superfamily ATPase